MAGKNDKADFSLTIGLNMDDLFAGMDQANTTIRQAISRINSESTQVKFKADTAALQTGISEVEKMRVQQQALTRQIELQTAKMRLLKQARDSVYSSAGANSTAGRSAETAYLRQERYVAQLNAQLTKLQANLHSSGSAFSRFRAEAERAGNGVKSLGGAYTLLSSKMAAAMGVVTTGAGLFNITDQAMKAGESLYQLSSRLHLTSAEAESLNRLFSISGVNIQGIIPYFSQLDKQILASGNDTNATSAALQRFGVSLTDSSGNLLPLNKQLDQLAQGYQRATEAGKAEEFQAQILGRRGAELVPLLANYNDNMKIAASVKTTGLLNVEEAHQLSLEWRAMKAESSQLSMAFGAAMMPIAKELMPEINDGMKQLVSYIHDHNDEIKTSIEGWAAALAKVGDYAGKAAIALGNMANTENRDDAILAQNVPNYTQHKDNVQTGVGLATGSLAALAAAGLLTVGTAGTGAPIAIPIAGAALAGGAGYIGGRNWASNDYRRNIAASNAENWANWEIAYHGQQVVAGKESQTNFEQQLAGAMDGKTDPSKWNKLAGALGDTTDKYKGLLKVNTDFKKAEQEAKKATDENVIAQKRAAQAAEWRKTAVGQLTEKIYSLTHNDVENATHAMYVEEEGYKAQGIPDKLIDQFVSAQSAKIAEDKFRNVTEPMAEAFRSDLQNQLAQVDLQARGYMKGGATKGQADAWAAQRKAQINADWDKEVASQIDSVWKDSLTKRLDEIEQEKQAWIKKGLDEVKATKWAEEQKHEAMESTAQSMFSSNRKYFKAWQAAGGINSGQAGVEAIARVMRRERGIPAGAATSPAELQAFSAAMKSANDNLVPIISDGTYRGVKQAYIEVLRGNYSTQEAVPTAAAYPAATQAPAAQATQDIVYHEWTPKEQAEVMKNAPVNYEGQLADELKLNTDALHDSVEAIDKNTSKQDSLTNPATTPAGPLSRYADMLEAVAKPKSYGLEAYTDALARATSGLYAPPAAAGGFDPALTRRTTPPEQSRGRGGNSVTVNMNGAMVLTPAAQRDVANIVAGTIIERERLSNSGNTYGR